MTNPSDYQTMSQRVQALLRDVDVLERRMTLLLFGALSAAAEAGPSRVLRTTAVVRRVLDEVDAYARRREPRVTVTAKPRSEP